MSNKKKGRPRVVHKPEAIAAWERIKQVISCEALGRLINLSGRAVNLWKVVPGHQVDKVVEATGIPLEILRPDIAALREASKPKPKELVRMTQAEADDALRVALATLPEGEDEDDADGQSADADSRDADDPAVAKGDELEAKAVRS